MQSIKQAVQANVLSLTEFEEAARACQPSVAVFDCDGTLWSGDAGSSFMAWSVENGLLAQEKIDWLMSRYSMYNRGELSEVGICGEMVQVYAGLREEQMHAAAKAFFEERIESLIFPEMRRLVADLQQSGCAIWAVSSTNRWAIEAGVRQFHIPPERVLAAHVAVRDGVLTDHVLDVPTDEAKVAALAAQGVTAPDAVFGNSIHDAAMLAIGRCAFPVNPTEALMERSHAAGWRVYFPASTR